jgi:hypothetical protein
VVVQTPPPEQVEAPPELIPYPVAVYSGIVVGNSTSSRPSVPTKTNTATTTAAAKPAPTPPAGPAGHRPSRVPNPGGHKRHWTDRVEYDLAQEAINHGNNPALQIQDLDTWKRRYPHSDYENDRNYYYVQAYSRVVPPQPAKVLAYAAPLVQQDIRDLFEDTDIGRAQTLNLLYLATVNAQSVSPGLIAERQTGQFAARKLLEYLPEFFTDSHRPANVTADLWTKARADMESTARKTLAIAGHRAH